jgi:hypothetical protein
MKHVMALFCGLALSASASAQGFFNLDFEKGKVFSNDPAFGFLAWDVAVPGWSHSDGSDTAIVYYGATHAGISQYYLLADSELQSSFCPAIDGRYSLVMRSGRASSIDLGSPFVNAFVAQTGLIPANALSIRLKAAGSVQLFVGGQRLNLQSLGGVDYGANILGIGGTLKEIRILNSGFGESTIDTISFSAIPVPEPSVAVLLGCAAVVLFLMRSTATLSHR